MKKNSLFLFFAIAYLTLLSPTWAANSILLLGDSVSASYKMKTEQGWVALLNQQLKNENANYYINNASISGETTTGGLARLPYILAEKKVDFLLIELGGNDGLRGYSPKLIKNNLLQIIKLAQDENIPVALMKIKITPNYGPRYNKMFEQVFDDISTEKNVPLLPFFVEEIILDPSLMQADGIHPNAKAQPLIADIVAEQLQQLNLP